MKFGLIGKNIDYSFSASYFNEKFKREGLVDFSYQNFDVQNLSRIQDIFRLEDLRGLNVTIPYKEKVLPYLDFIDPIAKEIGAVNTIVIKNKKLSGYNTDYLGFKKSLLETAHKLKKALILGSGGASKAVVFALNQLDVSCTIVSRKALKTSISYEQAASRLKDYDLVVNCTPLGTWPNVLEKPPLLLDGVNQNHLFYDLVYKPRETAFLKKAKIKGASTINGQRMLEIQALEAWDLWQSN